MTTLLQDLRFALRLLRKSPGFTIAAAVTLALAIGANAVVFGVMDALILRPLNVPQAESLWGTEYGLDPGFQSYPNYVDLRDRNRSFDDLAAFNFAFVGLDTGKDAFRASGYATTGNYFDVLKIHPYLGRFFQSSRQPSRFVAIRARHRRERRSGRVERRRGELPAGQRRECRRRARSYRGALGGARGSALAR